MSCFNKFANLRTAYKRNPLLYKKVISYLQKK